jgi:hypothetical protein
MPQSFYVILGVIHIICLCSTLFENLIQLVNIIDPYLWDCLGNLSCWILYQTCKGQSHFLQRIS